MKNISVVVASLNESEKLKSCLESVSDLTGEIIIFCLGEKDDTLDKLVNKYHARLILKDPVKYIELLRNEMLTSAKYEWVLILDPDEEVGDVLKNKLIEVSGNKDYSAVNLPTKNIMFGKWIKHSLWWPDKHIRFVKKGRVSWVKKIHSTPKVEGIVYDLPAIEDFALIHHSYCSFSEFFEKSERYSDAEANNLFKTGVKANALNFFYFPLREFFNRYFRYRGFLDGIYGFLLSYAMMVSRMMVWVKLWEMGKNDR